jgi:acyl-CoA thioester hydrolase
MSKEKPYRIEHLTTVYHGRVKFNDADPLGIVWHGNYLGYFEDGREYFGSKYRLTYLNIHEEMYSVPVVQSICNHKKPLKYGDEYSVKTIIIHTLAAKIIFHYEIYNQENELVCTGETTQVFLSKEGKLSLICPDFYESWKKQVGYDK